MSGEKKFLYERLGFVVLGVTDLDTSKDFYENMLGLDIVARSTVGKTKYISFCCAEVATSVVLAEADKAGLLSVGFKLQTEQDFNKARSHFVEQGYKSKSLPADHCKILNIDSGFTVFEPLSGVEFIYYHQCAERDTEFCARLAKIQRLGHVVIRTPKFDQVWKAMEDDFGMVASDFVENKGVWMRCYPNPLHHSFAIIKEEEQGLHHVNFMVEEIDDVGRARNRFLAANIDIVFGPGRHTPSGSVFLYFVDPDRLTLEYSYGMESFPAENPRAPRSLPLSAEVMDQWGGFPKPEFAANGEILKL